MKSCLESVVHFVFHVLEHLHYITCNLGLGAEGLSEVNRKGSLLVQVLDVAAIGLETASSTLGDIVLTGELGETPLLGDNNLLATSELELAATESLNDNG